MTRNTSNAAHTTTHGPKTADEALGKFTESAVGTGDAATRKVLTEIRAIALGLAQIFLAKDNPQDQAAAALLRQVNVGLGDVNVLVSQGMELIALAQDLEAKDAAYKTALAKLEAGRAKTHDVSVSFSNLARAKLGAQSPYLEKLGVKIVGGRKGMKRTPKVKTPGDGAPPAPAKA